MGPQGTKNLWLPPQNGSNVSSSFLAQFAQCPLIVVVYIFPNHFDMPVQSLCWFILAKLSLDSKAVCILGRGTKRPIAANSALGISIEL